MKKLLMPLMAGSLLLSAIAGSQAATFAQFLQTNGTAQNFSFSGSNSGVLTSAADPVQFRFASGSGFTLAQPGLADQNISAVLNLSATANGNPAILAGGQTTQQFSLVDFTFITTANQTVNGVFIPAGTVLLHGVDNALSLVPPLNASAVLDGSTTSATFHAPLTGFPNTIQFMSDYINFAGATNNGFAYSLTPGFTTTSVPPFGLFINPFTAAGTGTFTSTASPVPEPGTVALLSSLCVCGSVFGVRRLRRRKVA